MFCLPTLFYYNEERFLYFGNLFVLLIWYECDGWVGGGGRGAVGIVERMTVSGSY